MWSLPINCFVFTFIALMKWFPKSVCNANAKSSAVASFGSRKQSGRTLPFESAKPFVPPGNIAL